MITSLFIYLIIVNLFTFIIFGIDKLKAQRGAWRTPENTLLLLATIGGSCGAFLGMKVWRHKTQHKKFTILVPLLMVIHIAIILYLCS